MWVRYTWRKSKNQHGRAFLLGNDLNRNKVRKKYEQICKITESRCFLLDFSWLAIIIRYIKEE